MNLHALRLFHAVASSGSVTRAAKQLSISQPAITAQIKKFEKELALPLLQPDGRGIRLTDAGRQVKELADRLFAVERQIETLAEQYGRGDQGRLSLAATYLPANFLLPAWLAKFKQKHERVEMSVTTTNSSGALRLLQRMEADLALYGGLPEEHPDTIQAEELFQDELWFVVAPTHRHAGGSIGLDDMMREPFIMREEGSSTRERLFSLCRTYNVPSPRIALQFNGLHEAISAVIAGYGASFVSSLVVRDEVRRGELSRVHVEGVNLRNSIAICTRRGEHLSPTASNLVDLIRESRDGMGGG